MYPKSKIPICLNVLTIIVVLLGIHTSYAISETTPGPNTIDRYCSSGTCITPNNYTTSNLNATQGFYHIGQYPNGTLLSKSNKISIILSNTCIQLLKHGIPNQCLTYDQIGFLDNTNLKNAAWDNSTDYHHRVFTKFSAVNVFNLNPYIIMIDPDPAFLSISKVITIEDSSFVWINPDDKANNTNTMVHYNRFVSSPCESATVAPIISLVVDTVHYLENGCINTSFNDIKNNPRPDIAFDYNNPFSTLHYVNYIHQIKHDNIKDCIHFKCNYKDPYSNPAW